MNNSVIQITCRGQETSAKTLQVLGAVLFQAAEVMEQELAGRNALQYGDRLVWDIEVEGPDWDYLATGDVTHNRGADQIGIHRISFRADKMRLEGNRNCPLVGTDLVKELASRLESQEVLAH
jgi:hypothetical protein